MQPEVMEAGEQPRAEVVKQELQKVSKSVKENFISLAELLYEAWANQYHKDYGYTNFNDFTATLDLNPRKANWLVSITRTLHRLGIPWSNVEEIGWRKLGTISPVLDSTNYTEMLEEARENSLPVLEEKVKAMKQGREEDESPVRLTLQLKEKENSIVETALEQAMQDDNITTKGKALSVIAYDWIYNLGEEEE